MSQESVHQIDLVMFYFRELSPQNTFISITLTTFTVTIS